MQEFQIPDPSQCPAPSWEQPLALWVRDMPCMDQAAAGTAQAFIPQGPSNAATFETWILGLYLRD